VPIPTAPVVTLIEEVVKVDTAFNVLTFRVEYALTPGAPLLMEETVRLERFRIKPLMVLPFNVEYNTVGAVKVERAVMVLPVRVDRVRFTAFNAGTAELRRAR